MSGDGTDTDTGNNANSTGTGFPEPPEAWQDMDAKTLNAMQAAYLLAIYRLLRAHIGPDAEQGGDTAAHGGADTPRDTGKANTPDKRLCRVCGASVPDTRAAMQEHGRACFGWHSDLGHAALTQRYEHTGNDEDAER
jgi:hypothetical protein